jgi:DNA-binding GntR family transcriptional regulator
MNATAARRAAAPRPPTATDRVYDGIYRAIVEHRLAPGARLREEELAESFAVSRTVVRQALQRLAQDQIVDLRHNHGAQVPLPGLEDAAPVFDARRVVECEIARRLGGRLSPAQAEELRLIVEAEAQAEARGDSAAAIGLSGEFHRALARLAGNPVFVRLLDELLPTTSLLMALYKQPGRPACVAHRHQEMLQALAGAGAAGSAAEMRRHLDELERSLTPHPPPTAPLRDVFAAYRDRALAPSVVAAPAISDTAATAVTAAAALEATSADAVPAAVTPTAAMAATPTAADATPVVPGPGAGEATASVPAVKASPRTRRR